MVLHLLVLLVLLQSQSVRSSYSCLCSYAHDGLTVRNDTSSSATSLGVMNTYDCKPIDNAAAHHPGFITIQFQGKIGYVEQSGSTQEQLCAGYPSPLDIVSVVTASTTTTTTNTAPRPSTTKTPIPTTTATRPSSTTTPRSSPATTQRPSTTLLTTTLHSTSICRPGWKHYENSCYHFQTADHDAKSWEDAKDDCFNHGGHLVFIESAEEQQYIYDQIQKPHHSDAGFDEFVWVGLTDRLHEGHWMWEEDTRSIHMYGYQNWDHGQPNDNGGEDCVATGRGSSNSWNDRNCDHRHPYICEEKARNVRCENGWVLAEDTCYLFKTGSHDKHSWSGADEICRSHGGHLAFIQSDDEQKFLRDYLLQHVSQSDDKIESSLWIGATDHDKEGDWVWRVHPHTESMAMGDFTAWEHHEPNGHGTDHDEDCATVRGTSDYHWNDQTCSLHLKYICEKPPVTISATVPSTLSTNCEPGWVYYGSHCYLFKTSNDDLITWNDAQTQCDHHRSHLVYIESSSEQTFIQDKLQQLINPPRHEEVDSSLWIGATDSHHEGHWSWSDGTSKHHMDYEHWGHTEPNNHNGHEDCGVVRGTQDYKWNDYPCSFKLNYICEKDTTSHRFHVIG